MLVINLAFVMIVLLTIYYVSSSKISPKEYVKCVEAGPTSVGTIHNSSRPHGRGTIVGVVRYRI